MLYIDIQIPSTQHVMRDDVFITFERLIYKFYPQLPAAHALIVHGHLSIIYDFYTKIGHRYDVNKNLLDFMLLKQTLLNHPEYTSKACDKLLSLLYGTLLGLQEYYDNQLYNLYEVILKHVKTNLANIKTFEQDKSAK